MTRDKAIRRRVLQLKSPIRPSRTSNCRKRRAAFPTLRRTFARPSTRRLWPYLLFILTKPKAKLSALIRYGDCPYYLFVRSPTASARCRVRNTTGRSYFKYLSKSTICCRAPARRLQAFSRSITQCARPKSVRLQRHPISMSPVGNCISIRLGYLRGRQRRLRQVHKTYRVFFTGSGSHPYV